MRVLGSLIVIAGVMRTCITGPTCSSQLANGLIVTVVDSATGSPPAEATLTAKSATFTETVGPRQPSQTTPPVLILSTAPERPGVYAVTVRSPGYRDWTRTGIRVTADECHVKAVKLTARLQPT
jgi:hypothetical protein